MSDTDPALRALEPMTADEIERTRQQLRRPTFRANTPAMGLVADHLLATVDALAAAEAAPLDGLESSNVLIIQGELSAEDFDSIRAFVARNRAEGYAEGMEGCIEQLKAAAAEAAPLDVERLTRALAYGIDRQLGPGSAIEFTEAIGSAVVEYAALAATIREGGR